jgi:hypothetical protein
MRPAFAGKRMAVAVAYAEFAAEVVRDWRLFSFPTRNRKNALLCFNAVKVVKLAHAIVRVLKGKKSEQEGGRLLVWALPFHLLFFFPLVGGGLLLS